MARFLLPVEEWVGTINLRSGKVRRFVPRSLASVMFRGSPSDARHALFHTHPPCGQPGTDRPSAMDVYTTLRLYYPIHCIVTQDGLFVLVKTSCPRKMRKHEFFKALAGWEDISITHPRQVSSLFHRFFGATGVQCHYFPIPSHVRSVIEAVETVPNDFYGPVPAAS